VGVEGGFGSVVIGRDYTPLFGVSGVVDPFVTNGVGSSYNLLNNVISTTTTALATQTTFRTKQAVATSGAATSFDGTTWGDPNAIRMSNAVGYTSPSLSGFSVAAMYSFGNENTGFAKAAGTGASARLSYAQGPLAISFGSQAVKGGDTGAVAPAVATDKQRWITNFLGGSYDFGILKLSAGYKIDMLSGDAALSDRLKGTIVGVTAPVGPVVLRASYVERRLGDAKIGNQGAVGVSYDLSKRTALYANYADLDNEAGYGMTVYGASGANAPGNGAPMSTPGGRSRGLELGVRHIF
jgi:predicted porin